MKFQRFSFSFLLQLKSGIKRDNGLRELADRAQRMETKGSLLSSATVHALAFVFKRSFISDT